MFQVVFRSISTGRVQRRIFGTWEAARRCVDACTDKGQHDRLSLERVETQVTPTLLHQTPRILGGRGRSFSA